MSSVKTEALLLFCRDLINTYKDDKDNLNNISVEKKDFVEKKIYDINKAINVLVQKNKYYINNYKVSRIKIIVKYYNFINKAISHCLKTNTQFSPAMLCFSLLASWFKELEHENQSKEYIFFNLFAYNEVFDELIIKVDSKELKNLNINMIVIAEEVMIKLNNKGLKN